LSSTHLFVPWVLFWVYRAVATVHRGDIKGHRIAILGLYIGALLRNGLDNVFVVHGITHDIFLSSSRALMAHFSQ
jgi:uncharacterized membrane protein